MKILILLFLSMVRVLSDVTLSGSISVTGDFVAVSGALSAPNKAHSLSPSSGAERIAVEPTLSWSNGGGATSYDVYFDTVNPPITKVVDDAAQVTYEPATLDYSTTYYWRVDPKNSVGTTTGDVYSFSTYVPIVSDVLIDFETETSGELLTATIMTNATKGSIGSWSVSGGGQLYGEISDGEKTVYTPVNADGVIYTDAGSTRGARFRIDQLTNYVRLDFTTPVDELSLGTWIKFGSIGASFQTVDYINIRNNLGGTFVAQTGSTFKLHGHGDTESGTGIGSEIDITSGTWYWMTMKYVRASECTLRLYSESGVLVGESTFTIFKDSPASYIIFGRTDNHNAGAQPPDTSWVYFDDLAIDVTDATFPLGP